MNIPAPSRPSPSRMVARVIGWVIQAYRYTISPLLGPRCRFHPSCSAYALEALQQHGLRRGGWLALTRLAKCHPWGGSGVDLVPEADGTPGVLR